MAGWDRRRKEPRTDLVREDQGPDWSEFDLARHWRLVRQADAAPDMVRAQTEALESIVRRFAHAAAAAGGVLTWQRDAEALVWRIALQGPSCRAHGIVEVTLESAASVTIVARPNGHPPLQYTVHVRPEDHFVASLRDQFRLAVARSVLDAASLIAA